MTQINDPSVFRGLRRLVSGLVLGAGAIALDAAATPDLPGQEPWLLGPPRGDESAPDNDSRPEALPAAAIEGPHPNLEFGEVPYDTGILQAAGSTLGEDPANFLRAASGMTLNSIEVRQPDIVERVLALVPENAIREVVSQASALIGSSGPAGPPAAATEISGKESGRVFRRIFEMPETFDDVVALATHPFTLLVVLICLLGWLTAKVMNHIDRLRAVLSRSPGRRRHRGRRSRSR